MLLCGFFAYVTAIQIRVRLRYGISGTMVEDATAVTFLYFFLIEQMLELVDSDEVGAPTGEKKI